MSRKQPTTIIIQGVSMTERKQQELDQALRIELAKRLDGETADVTIRFDTEEF
jgi:hypothetical protein